MNLLQVTWLMFFCFGILILSTTNWRFKGFWFQKVFASFCASGVLSLIFYLCMKVFEWLA